MLAFASCDDPVLLQRICDTLAPGAVQAWSDRWMSKIPLPLTDAGRDAGFWWQLSMRQIETSRTLVFDDDVHARAFFEALSEHARHEVGASGRRRSEVDLTVLVEHGLHVIGACSAGLVRCGRVRAGSTT
ncbi:MAG TPA: hypothetical protein VFQ44_30805 [Streptosporangiaceae bacterium]|nr:hypothetical protein [Streptosporangiaceae bacterium]